MRILLSAVVCGALLLGMTSLTSGEEVRAESEQPRPRLRVNKPWSLIASLTDEQKRQILAIREKHSELKRQIEEQEKQAILALLSDEQKQELADALEAEAAARKAADAARREAARQGKD